MPGIVLAAGWFERSYKAQCSLGLESLCCKGLGIDVEACRVIGSLCQTYIIPSRFEKKKGRTNIAEARNWKQLKR